MLVQLIAGKTTREINLAIPQNIAVIQPEDPLYHYWAYTQKIPHYTTGTHSSLNYSTYMLDITQMSLNKIMDTENMVH